MTILVTGGAGFIGSAVVRQYLTESEHQVVNVDSLTYAGDLSALGPVRGAERHHFEHVDICDPAAIARVLRLWKPDAVMHLAAESHVDRSIAAPGAFVRTNIVGTAVLLEAVLTYWDVLDASAQERFRFHQVSTDEVYGSTGPDETFEEDAPYRPSSPYSASKAAADHLVRAWHQTYGLPVLLSHSCNNYGPWQYPDKLIPRVVQRCLTLSDVPVYGTGQNVRDWLHVEDHARALRLVLERGQAGRSYNIGGGQERLNIELVRQICAIVDDLAPDDAGPRERLIALVPDRPGHDLRYAMSSGRMLRELGWSPACPFEAGLRATVAWMLANPDWMAKGRPGAVAGSSR
ncbi:MAG: dTDP-glucose 4,6-dehydratase [Myxococcales bacterium]|nr:dTDP-glucose 4,6-dehydratase [Myxococcales bacterium]